METDLMRIRNDLWAILSACPQEVEGIREAVAAGRVDGQNYVGACACLIGTIANLRNCPWTEIPFLKPDKNRPIELFISNIRPRQTPAISWHAAKTVEWIEEWQQAQKPGV